MKRRSRNQPQLVKENCEVCGFDRPAALNFHHIIPHCDPRCTNDNHNIAIVCHSCHDLIHVGEIIIIGVYPSTNGRKLMWFHQGEQPPLDEMFWKVRDNPMVVRKISKNRI